METFGKTVTGVLMAAMATIIKGFVFVKLWDWFVSETFGIMQVSLLQAMGITLFISVMLFRDSSKDKDKDKSFLEIITYSFFLTIYMSAFALLYGYIIKSLM